jgi:hypothetical protein
MLVLVGCACETMQRLSTAPQETKKQQQPTTQTGTSSIALTQPPATTPQTTSNTQTNLSKQKTKTTHCTLSQTFLTKKPKYKNKPNTTRQAMGSQ